MKKEEIDAIESIDEFEDIICSLDVIDVSGRGGKVGVKGSRLAAVLGIEEDILPPMFGIYCNYLGGGMRGALCRSGFSPNTSLEVKELLESVLKAIERIYLSCENPMNEEYLDDGEINWDAVATNSARRAGVKSAY